MKIKKRLLTLSLFSIGMVTAATAFAARNWAYEIGYFDEYGNLNGSVTYPCGGGKTIEGVLVGTPVEIWREACLGYEPPGEH